HDDPANATEFLGQVRRALKPGGILGVIDHEGTPGADNASLHRIAFADAVKVIVNAGFALVGTSELLDNPDDDHTLRPFDPSLGRNTDRFTLKFRKPAP
ncbi:MAG: methyltransferase, partial [Gammaproteobacteria bacterium]